MIVIRKRLTLCCFIFALLSAPFFTQATHASGTFSSDTWCDPSGTKHRYVVFEPEVKYGGTKPPIILFLNGFGENGSDGFNQARANFGPAIWEKRHRFPFLAVFPQCGSGESWSAKEGNQLNKAISILDKVINSYNGDKERVYVTGASTGGAGAWHAAARFPNKFAAAAPLCARIDPNLLPLIKKSRIPVWNFCCEDERERLLEHNRSLIKELRNLGANPLYSETPGEGHNCWDYVYRMPALYEWLLSHRLISSDSSKGNRQIVKTLNWIPDGSTKPPLWPIDQGPKIVRTEKSHVITSKVILKAWQQRESKSSYASTKWVWQFEEDGFWSGNQPFWESPNGLPIDSFCQNELLLIGPALYYKTKRQLYDNALILNKELSNRYDLAAVKKFKNKNFGMQELFALTRFEEGETRVDKYSNSSRRLFDELLVPKDHLLHGAKLRDTTDLDTLGYAPLTMHYRAISSKSFGLNPNSITIDDFLYQCDDLELIRLTEKLSDLDQRIYFVAPALDYSIVKMEAYRRDKLVCQIETEYSKNKTESYSPSSWRVAHIHNKHDRWPSYLIASVEKIEADATNASDKLPSMATSEGDALFNRDSAKYYLVRQNGKKEEVHYSLIEELNAIEPPSSTIQYYFVLIAITALLLGVIALRKKGDKTSSI